VQIEGITLEVIAQKLKISTMGLRKILKRLGLPTPAQVQLARKRVVVAASLQPRTRANKQTTLWESRREEMKQMLDDGYTPTQLAVHFDVPAYTAYSWVRRFKARNWLPEGVPHPTAPTVREAKATLLALTPPPVT
jgi:hypothetical protein